VTTVTEPPATELPSGKEPFDPLGRRERQVSAGLDRDRRRSPSVYRSVRLCVEVDGLRRSFSVRTADPETTESSCGGERVSPLNQTVSFAGSLDLGTSARALNRLIDAIETGEGCLSVNLDRVSSITTTGVLVLDAAERHARRHHRQLVVVGAHENVRSVLELVGLGRLVAGSEPARVA